MDPERLWALLPALYRQGDEDAGGVLRALLRLMEEELAAVETLAADQYDDWFIETCSSSAVARIGELVGVPAPPPGAVAAARYRSLVADALARRRRKGVAAALEDVAVDVTGWPVRVVEYFRLVGRSAHTRFPDPLPGSPAGSGRQFGRTVDVRDRAGLSAHGTAFATVAARPDVHGVVDDQVRYRADAVGVFFWPGETLTAGPVAATPVAGYPGCLTLDPLGRDRALAVLPRPRPGTIRPGELDLPVLLTRDRADRHARALIGPGLSLEIRLGDRLLSADDVAVTDLGTWPTAAAATPASGPPVRLDPERGRIVLADPAAACVVTYAYRTPAAIGGGSYPRTGGLVAPGRTVGRDDPGPDPLGAALAAPPRAGDVLTVRDDAVSDADVTLDLPADGTVVVQAADGARPALRGRLRVSGGARATLVVDGLAIGGGVTLTGDLHLVLRHVDLAGLLTAESGEPTVEVSSCLLAAVRLGTGATLTAQDSVIDAGAADAGAAATGGAGEAAVALAAGRVELTRVTVFGSLMADRITASDSVLDGVLQVRRRQVGALSYCYVPPDSGTPPRFRCQPDVAIGTLTDPAAVADVLARTRPRWRSLDRTAPTYAELAGPPALTTGALDGAELGAHGARMRPQRLAALRAAVDEYLPYGVEAGIIDAR